MPPTDGLLPTMTPPPETRPQRIGLLVFPGVRAFDVSVITEVWDSDRTSGASPVRTPPSGRGPAHPGTPPGRPHPDPRPPPDLARRPHPHGPRHRAGHRGPGRRRPAPGPRRPPPRPHRRHPGRLPLRGRFVLARAGLLDGRRAVTHWHLARTLAARHPAVRVEPDALFVEDSGIWTSAGTAAGIDLCLHLVRTAHGAEAAATVARSMVTAPFRTGTQAQFIERPTPRADRDADALAAVRAHALAHLSAPHTVASLAAVAGMSPAPSPATSRPPPAPPPALAHHPARRRGPEAPGAHRPPLPEVARRAGFGSEVTMRQHFASHLSTSPRAYRNAFRHRAPDQA